MSPVGATSLWIAAARALESESESPLFIDPYARELAGESGFAMMTSMRQSTGAPVQNGPDPTLSVRTRFLDDGVVAAVRDRGLTQVVIMAAGMDTRAFRIDWPAGVTVFELDRDDVFDYKEPILARLGATASCDRRILRVDLSGEWVRLLLAAGFDTSRPAAFVVEGLLMYLEPDAAMRLFEGLSEIAADGSWIGGDTINGDVLRSAFTTGVLKRLEALGFPWRFGPDDPDVFLAEYGWHGKAVVPGEPEARYHKWTYPVLPRSMPGVPRMYFFSAIKGAPVHATPLEPISVASAEHYTWGSECEGWHLMKSDALSVIQERMPPGTSEKRHRHVHAVQFFYVLRGELHIEVDGRMHHVSAGSGLEVRRGQPHQVFNNDTEATEFIVVSQPPSHGDRIDA